jgi:hypothetical protein
MARANPRDRETRTKAAVASMNKVHDLITTGPGNLIGSMIEKAKLKGKPGSGTHTATETGAKQAAADRLAKRNNKAVMDSAGSTESFEDLISGKKKSY